MLSAGQMRQKCTAISLFCCFLRFTNFASFVHDCVSKKFENVVFGFK